MKFLSCFRICSGKNKQGSELEPISRRCIRCKSLNPAGDYCAPCQKISDIDFNCHFCGGRIIRTEKKSECEKCKQPVSSLFKPKQTQQIVDSGSIVLFEVSLISAASQFFEDPKTDFGHLFDLQGTFRDDIVNIANVLLQARARGKTQCYYFIEIEPDYWITIMVNIEDQFKFYAYTATIICPTAYTPRLIYDYVIPKLMNLGMFGMFIVANAELHSFGFSTLMSCALSAIASRFYPEKAKTLDESILMAKSFWRSNPGIIIPEFGSDPLRGFMTDEEIQKLLMSFTTALLEVSKKPALKPKIEPQEQSFKDTTLEVTTIEPQIAIQEKPVKSSRIKLVLAPADIVPMLNPEEFLRIFPRLLNGMSYCSGSSAAFLSLFLRYEILGLKPTSLLSNDKNGRIFMRKAMVQYRRKYNRNQNTGNSFQNLLWWFMKDEVPKQYRPFKEILSQLQILDCPHMTIITDDLRKKVIPYIDLIFNYVPRMATTTYFGIPISNEELDIDSRRPIMPLTRERSMEIIAFVSMGKGQVHYRTYLKHNNAWFMFCDLSGNSSVGSETIVEELHNATFLVIKQTPHL